MDTISKQKKVFLSLEDLTTHKAELKQEIEAQKLHILGTSKEIVSPISMIISIASTLHKGLNLINGIQAAFKTASFIKGLFSKK